jgi:type II secretory pathway pseudopilin PulG
MVKLKATTIIETVIAMAIILIVFLVAGTIFLDVTRSSVSEKKIRASETVNSYLNNMRIEKIPDRLTDQANGLLIETEIQPFRENVNIALVHCRIYEQGKKVLAEQKRLMRVNR